MQGHETVPGASRHDWARVLSVTARELASKPDEQGTLSAIVRAAVHTVPGAAHGGVTQVQGRKVSAQEPSDPAVRQCDELQVELGQGPCLDAIWTQQTVIIDEMTTETRWPDFAVRAAALGPGSLISFRLYVRENTLGALNLYGEPGTRFDEQARLLGEVFATHAALALGEARHVRQLNEALANRDMIGQAKGLLMGRHDITGQRAFDMLVSASQETNIKLTEVARWMVEKHDNPETAPRPHQD